MDKDADRRALESISDPYTRNQITKFAHELFSRLLEDLIQEVHRPTVRSILRVNRASFGGIMQLSQLRLDALSPHVGAACLGGFLYMAIHQAARQAEQTEGRSEECLQKIIDKFRRCNELGTVFHSRCSDPRAPANHVKERLQQAYSLHLAFIGVIVEALDRSPLASINDERWKLIERREEECAAYLQVSEAYLFNIMTSNENHRTDARDTKDTMNVRKETMTAESPSIYVLPKQMARFHGRENELKAVRTSLAQHNSVTLRGIAGVGKTSLALHFAYQSLSDYSVILWMRSEPKTALDQSCQEALRRLGRIPEGQKQVIESRQIWRDYMTQASFRWLVIFDNVEQAEDLEPFWPPGGNGKIIVTAKKPEIGFELTDDEIAINPFTSQEGRECILSLITWPGGLLADPESASELNDELGGLPLGIVHMTALMRARKSPVKSFLRDYRRDKSKYHSKEAAGISGIYPKVKPKIGSNWSMSFDALQDHSKSLLGILSFVSSDNIPQDLFKHWDEGKSRRTLGLLPYCNTADDFLDVEEDLMKLALVDKDPNTEMLSLHRLEQVQFEYYLESRARQTAFDQAAKLLYDVFPKEHTGQRFTGRWHECGRYIQHATVLNSHYLKQDPKLDKYTPCPEFAKLMSWCSWYLFEIADYSSIQQTLTGGIGACKTASKKEFDDATWGLLNYNAGTVDTSRGAFEKAETSLNEALRVRRGLKVPNTDDVAATLNNLGLLYNSIHKFDVAEKHYTEAFQIHLDRPESEDRNLSLTMVKHNLQRNAIQSGKSLPPVEELQSTVDFFRNTISWWMTGHAYLVLGNLLFKLKRYQDAAQAYKNAKDTLGAQGRAGKQPATAMCIYKQGCVAFSQSDYTKAAEYFRESIAISKLYPAIPAEQARTQFMLASALHEGGTLIKANEEKESKIIEAKLQQAYFEMNGRSDTASFVKASDFDIFITAKYQ